MLLARHDIESKVIGRIGGQLLLPVVQQLGAQQGNQRHGKNNQGKRKNLANGQYRLSQQIAQTQPPGQVASGQNVA